MTAPSLQQSQINRLLEADPTLEDIGRVLAQLIPHFVVMPRSTASKASRRWSLISLSPPPPIPPHLTTIASLLEPYTTNGNTGNIYEIITILEIGRKMGLLSTDLDTLSHLFERILEANPGKRALLHAALARVESIQPDPDVHWTLGGQRIVGMRNITQSDDIGKTGDIQLITDTGATLSVSVCEGKQKRDDTIEKCLTNPSCTRLGLGVDDKQRIDARAADAVVEYKAHMAAKHGNDEAAWPSRGKTMIAHNACCDVAKWTAERFVTFTNEEKTTIVRNLLRIDVGTDTPADYLAIVNKKTSAIVFYRFSAPSFTDWSPDIKADGIWLCVMNNNSQIGKIQVKFNNGVYHKGKTSSLSSSWNFTVNLTRVFNLARVTTAQT